MIFHTVSDTSLSIVPLGADDLERCLAVLPLLYRAMDMTSFPRVSLMVLNELIPTAIFSSYNEVDMRTGGARVLAEPESFTAGLERFRPVMWTYRAQHPLMARFENGLHDGVWKISDFLNGEAFHALDIYTHIFAKIGVEDTLSMTLQSNEALKVFYAINGTQNFTERDRAVLVTLQPHLTQAFENAIAFTKSRALFLLSARAISDSENHGFMLVDASGRIQHANERGCKHLIEAFPSTLGEMLPPELMDWVIHSLPLLERPHNAFELNQLGTTFIFRSAAADEGTWIIVSRCEDESLLSKALVDRFHVTLRQAEVLLWLSRGKTNFEIGSILKMSERTVAKHLQLVFQSLGVENRHCASLKVMDALGACRT